MRPKPRILTILALLMFAIPKFALSDAHVRNSLQTAAMSTREVHDERDPKEDTEDCSALGELDIVFRTDNNGPPAVGVVLTDPRGRRIGFDPLTKHAWQELPLAQAYINCDDLDGAGGCRGLVQICGPVSGTYQLEIIAKQTTAYTVSISGRSRETRDDHGFRSFHSEANVNNVAIHTGSRDAVLLDYSRDPKEKVAAVLQRSLRAQPYETRFHQQRNLSLREKQ
jgi:hypothetical protein